MNQDPALRTICIALQNQAAVSFVRTSLTSGYQEFFPTRIDQVEAMLDEALDQLSQSQQKDIDPRALVNDTSSLLEHVFKKGQHSFWFNHIYHQYKTQTKPDTEFQQLKTLITGERVLDFGCGSGYLAARLARGGYQVFTTDVLDYRYDEARYLPFIQMASPTDIPYPDVSMDTALVQAVLHHIDPGDLPQVIQGLAKVARHVLIKEDTYNLPADLPGLAEVAASQPLLKTFMGMPSNTQYQVLVLIDFFANAVAQGLPEMNMPFAFRSVSGWREVLPANGLRISKTLVAGFEPGRMHKSCHVWFICEPAM